MNKKSGHWTNTGMAKFINDNLYNYKSDDEKSMNPFRWYRLQNGDDVSKYRETINGFPCRLILINDGETPLNEGQNEPTPGNTKDMGIFNFNNDKDNVTTLGFNSDIFPNCASYEVTANSDTSAGAFMSYKSNPIIEIAKQTISGTEYYATMYMGPLVPSHSIIKTDAEISSALRYNENVFDKFGNIITVNKQDEGVYEFRHNGTGTHYRILFNANIRPTFIEINDVRYNVKIVEEYPENVVKEPYIDNSGELAYLKESFELRHPDEDDVAEDWGFMGVEEEIEIFTVDYYYPDGDTTLARRTSLINVSNFGDTITINGTLYHTVCFYDANQSEISSVLRKAPVTLSVPENAVYFNMSVSDKTTSIVINDISYNIGNLLTTEIVKEPYMSKVIQEAENSGLKYLIDWVDNCADEEFVRDFEKHFHKDYTLRYFCLVTLIGAVDNLGGQYSCRV